MKIAIMSDSHDRWDNLGKAIEKTNNLKCKYLLFAGDLIAPPGVYELEKFNGKVKLVWGNNEGEKVGLARKINVIEKIELCDDVFEGELDGIKIFMNHYPRITELAAKSQEFDLCIYGHTHEYQEKTINKTLIINPGEIQGFASGISSFVIFDTITRKSEKILI